MSSNELPYSDETFERICAVLRTCVGQIAIDPRLSAGQIGSLVSGVVVSEQYWLNSRREKLHNRQAPVYLSIFETVSSFQAYAIQPPDDPNAYIALSFSAVLHLVTYFNMVFCHPELLRDFGDAAAEQGPKIFPGRDPEIVPTTLERQFFCRLATQMALRFLVAHEHTHILNGHLRLRLDHDSLHSLAENRRILTADQALESQTLEMDADSGAVVACLTDSVLRLSDNGAALVHFRETQCKPISLDRKYLRLWMFAIESIFRIMENEFPWGSAEISSHPRPPVRLAMVILTADRFLERAGHHEARNDLVEAAEMATLDVNRAADLFAFRADRQNAFDETTPDQGLTPLTDYLAKLAQKWSELRPLLEPLSTSGGKLAPAIPISGE